MEKVYFKPWLGKNYDNGINGKKILVLGESHHCPELAKCNLINGCRDLTREDCMAYTTEVMDIYLNYKLGRKSEKFGYWMNTFTRFANIFYDKSIFGDDVLHFWDSLIFYNYVQYSMADSRISPSPENFQFSQEAFLEILSKYLPDVIIVWGNRLWNNLDGGEYGEESNPSNRIEKRFYYYTVGNKKIPAFPINHPASSAFNYSWHEIIAETLRKI